MRTKPTKIIPLVGKVKESGAIERVPNMLVIRKGIEKPNLISFCRKYKMKRKNVSLIAFVSSPYMYINPYVRHVVELWLHPFKSPKKYLPKSNWHFMSESDFVDVLDYPSYPKYNTKWDYFYFTLGGDDGVKNKGYNLFKSIVPALSHLKGVVIVYGKQAKFPKSEIRFLKKSGIKLFSKSFSPAGMQKIYSSVKFGLFPNITDCSPRTIPECLVHNTPILVNADILGGWKYVNEDTGAFFDRTLTKDQINEFIERDFRPKKSHLKNYGFKKSARKMAEILAEYYPQIEKYEMVYFETHKHIMERVIQKCE